MSSAHKQSSQQHFIDAIDNLRSKLFTIEPASFEQIEQWRQTAYRSIDSYCAQKCDELIEKKRIYQSKELDHLQNEIEQLIESNDIKQDQYDSMNHAIQLTEIKIHELEHLRLTVQPLIIDENLLVHRHLFPLTHPYRTIRLKTIVQGAIGTNDQHLLVYRDDQHLCLLDRNLNLIKEISFPYESLHGICWSNTIARFILITFKDILLLDEKTMILKKCSIPSAIDWWRGTCSDENLFLTTVEWGSSIYQYHLRSSFELINEWHAPISCTKEEIICDLKYNNGFLAMPIFNKHKEQSRLELRSELTLDCLWSVRIHGRCRCCSIDIDQWLVMDHDDCRFFHISADGKLLESNKYNQHEQVEDVIPWGTDNIVILTKKTINLHKFN